MLEIIDLSIYPKIHHHHPSAVITIGDLHANPILLIYFLQKNGIITLSPKTYQDLYRLYQEIGHLQRSDIKLWTSDLQEQYCSFLKLLDEIAVNPCRNKIRFLGDELADRGECDLFIMLILSKLHDNAIDFSILVSNHGMAFLSSMQYILNEKWQDDSKMVLDNGLMRSFLGLQKLLFHQAISKNWLKKWLENVYLPHLELLDYAISQNHRHFYIFTHAAMGEEALKALAAEYQVNWCDDNMDALATTLQNLKQVFCHQKKEALITLFRNHAFNPEEKWIHNHLIHTVFWRKLLWNRQYEQNRPFMNHSFRIFNVHGHDQGFKKYHDYFISLDAYLGKNVDITQGLMKTFVTLEKKWVLKKVQASSTLHINFFKPFITIIPRLNQTLLILSIGYIFKDQLSFIPLQLLMDYIGAQIPFYNKIKLLKT